MSSRRTKRARGTRVALALVAAVLAWLSGVGHAAAEPAPVIGSGSTYVALAMKQWVAQAQQQGLRISYQPVGSPQGLDAYGSRLTDFAGSEAEYASLSSPDIARGYQYIPDVAGAIAVMYNAKDTAGRKIDYLNLSRRTIARIFVGDITMWSDPAIAADNKNLVRLPDEKIRVVLRSGQSGTTALFYDFVRETAPDLYEAWRSRYNMPSGRIVEVFNNAIPGAIGATDSDLVARATKSEPWTVGFDEFGYAKVYDVPVAFVDNDSGVWTKPYARNISRALESAGLRPDLTQELSKVYSSKDPEAYPISAYSYLIVQCAPAPDRTTCKGPYADAGKAETLATWMRFIACDGQKEMARIGYSPLPVNLSQEMANSIARMSGGVPEQLNPGNCGNPRFTGDPPVENPPNPIQDAAARGETGDRGGGDGGSGGGGQTGAKSGSGGPTNNATATPGVTEGATTGTIAGINEATSEEETAADVRKASPVRYDRPGLSAGSIWPLVFLILIFLVPLGVGVFVGVRRNKI